MAAMMLPSMWPVLAIHTRVVRWRAQRGPATPGVSAAFIAGYLASWTLYGLAAYGLLLLFQAAGLDTVSDVTLNRYVLGPIALVAAAYQLTPLKEVCLRHCRHPLFFLMEHWHDGVGGSARVGLRHGAYCVGCCWALMLVLLGLGFMSVTWMAAGAGAIALEKLAPPGFGRVARATLAIGFLVLGVIAIAFPEHLPGTVTMEPMDSMMQ
jgi:predicted metal-binding membrane protein